MVDSNTLQAQADEQAEVMRKKLEEKRRQRAAPMISKVNEPSSQDDKPLGKPPMAAVVNQSDEESDARRQWGESPQAPLIAQQCDATGAIIEGEANVHYI